MVLKSRMLRAGPWIVFSTVASVAADLTTSIVSYEVIDRGDSYAQDMALAALASLIVGLITGIGLLYLIAQSSPTRLEPAH
jgi:hypothetical protein